MEGLKAAWDGLLCVPGELKANWPAIITLGWIDFLGMYLHDAAPAGDTLFQSRLTMAAVNGVVDASKFGGYQAVVNGASY